MILNIFFVIFPKNQSELVMSLKTADDQTKIYEDNFKLIDTESADNKCLYYAFFRANHGRLEAPKE